MINIDQFNPYIIGVHYYNGMSCEPGKTTWAERDVLDYEIEYIIEGSGSMITDGVIYPAQSGMIFFRRPRQKNTGIMPYKCYLITFDILGNSKNRISQFDKSKENYQQNIDLDIPVPAASRIFFNEKTESILEHMHSAYLQDSSIRQILMKSFFYQLVYEIILNRNNDFGYDATISPAVENKVKKCIDFIQQNYEKSLDISQLASSVNLSTSHLYKVFKQATGMSPLQYIINLKLEKAKKLLIQTDMEIKEVCYSCTFDDVSYFCKLFKQKTKITPLSFRERNLIKI